MIRITAPTCAHCKRILIVTDDGKCLCCGKEAHATPQAQDKKCEAAVSNAA